ncbi:hypothetical protein TKK_0000312 [Trichogramma kaykai]|uniref:Uncharacterized protein n=1 Tax=Trichogramma kaykai TaxID=54128 RepID=A0ABD2W759_9HYME
MRRKNEALKKKWRTSDWCTRKYRSQYHSDSIVVLQLLMLPHLTPTTNTRKLSKTENWKVSVGDSKQTSSNSLE